MEIKQDTTEVILDFSILISVMVESSLVSGDQSEQDFLATLLKHVRPLAVKELRNLAVFRDDDLLWDHFTLDSVSEDETESETSDAKDQTQENSKVAEAKLLLAYLYFQGMVTAISESEAALNIAASVCEQDQQYVELAAESQNNYQMLNSAAASMKVAWQGEQLCRMRLSASQYR